jgi:predicted nucleic acid-binding protein
VSACVLDTDVVIAAMDRRDAHHESATAAITAMIATETELLLSLINYAEALVRPAENEHNLRSAIDAMTSLGIRLVAPTPAIARDAARHRGLDISLADGFAIATAQARRASLASFDLRVRRALPLVGVEIAAQMP